MKKVDKEYPHPFLLEPTKLNRIIDTVHGSFAAIPNATLHDNFEVFLTGDRREELPSVDTVLALDNTRKHKIQRLVIFCSASSPGFAKPDHEVQVDFGGPSSFPRNSTTVTKVVSIGVRGESASWNSRTLAEIEEQVERTQLHHTRPLGVLILILAVAVIVLAAQFLNFAAAPLTSSDWWLKHSDLDRLAEMLKQHPTLTDEDLREIETRQLKNVLEYNGVSQRPTQTSRPARAVLLPLACVSIIGCVIILFTCYPSAVFLWGDEQARYETILQRRKAVWGVIVSVMLAGVVSRLWFDGLSSWLQKP
jgi:hypothetical protein